MSSRSRWLALLVLCLGDVMIVLDTTVVNVALPSIRADLGFNETSLVWVINAYMLTFAGFLLLGGRLGDLYGQRRLFLIGLALFTLASLGCGLAETQSTLIIARALQGLGGAIVSAIALSLIMNLFTEAKERAKAMGIIGFVAAGGGSLGVLLGGLITGTFDWHWNFLINIPIGIGVFIACLYLLPHSSREKNPGKLDIWGAITVTASLMIAVYAIVNGNYTGWMSKETLGLLALSAMLIALFVWIEARVSHPLMPLSLFRLRSVLIANIVGTLWSAAMFAWFFISALYMQLVLGYTPMQVGLAFLPANLLMAAFSLGISAWMVNRFGIRWPLTLSMLFIATGLALFSLAPVQGTFILHVLPAMILLGVGSGMAFNPVLLAAMNDVAPEDTGLASGVVNTAFMMGGSLGLAILASLAASKTNHSIAIGADNLSALTNGYTAAFFVGALFAAIAAFISAIFFRDTKPGVHVSH